MENILNYLFGTFGSFAFIIIIIAGIAWFIIKEQKKSNESLMKNQQNMNVNLISSLANSMNEMSHTITNDLHEQNKLLIEHLISQDINKVVTHNKNLIGRREVTSEINALINNLCLEIGALRVCVIEFHNSLFNQTGFPFLKYTVTYEKITKGCKTIQQNYQGVQFSSIAQVCENILKSHKHIYELNSLDEIDNIVPIMLCDGRTNLNAALFKGIFDNEDNDLIGLICIEFTNKIPENYDKTLVISTARTIGELITLKNEIKETCDDSK